MTEPVATTPNQLLAIDCHVHVHDWAQFVTQLDAALRAFTAAVASLRTGSAFHGILVLTEPAGRNTFAKLVSQLDGEGACAFNPGWTLTALPDSLALKASHIDGGHLFLISGQQIVTSENLEVLAIHAAGTIPDRLNMAGTIRTVEQLAGFPLIPWGVGKWLGKRGKVVSQAIIQAAGLGLGLADNSGRPACWQSVRQFTQARSGRIPILRGSDPLPLPGQAERTGSFGCLITCPFDPQQPGVSLVKALQNRTTTFVNFGELETFSAFCRNQIALRLRY